jgi:hypothetical protein
MAASTRPLTLGEILDRTVQLYRSNFLLLAGIAAPAAGLIVLISGTVVLFFSSKVFALAQAGQAGQTAPVPFSGQDMLVLGLVITLFVLVGIPLMLGLFSMALAALNYAAFHLNRGETVTIRASYGYAFRHFWRHVGILFLQSLLAGIVPYFAFTVIVVIGTILGALLSRSGAGNVLAPLLIVLLVVLAIAMVVACVLLWLRFSLAYSVSVAEDQKAWPSLKRSNRLSTGTRGRIFVMFLLIFVLNIIASLALAIPLDIVIALSMHKSVSGGQLPSTLLTAIQVANLGAGFLVRIFVMPIYATALVLFYVDQRTRMEGYDIEQLMAQAGWSQLPPPPSPLTAHPYTPESATTFSPPIPPAPVESTSLQTHLSEPSSEAGPEASPEASPEGPEA